MLFLLSPSSPVNHPVPVHPERGYPLQPDVRLLAHVVRPPQLLGDVLDEEPGLREGEDAPVHRHGALLDVGVQADREGLDVRESGVEMSY